MIKVGTLFSGIGAPEQALNKLGVDYELLFAGDIDRYCKRAYFANYKIDQSKWHNDITNFDATPFLDKIDLLIGGSPCQAFSTAGRKLGFKDTRGTLFFQYARVLNECKPKAFIFENVPNLMSHDKGKTFETITNTFKELGYHIHYKKLDAKDYGVPQSRRRVFIVGFRNDVSFAFPDPIELTTTVQDLLEDKVAERYYLSQSFINNYVMVSTATWNKHPQNDKPIAQCLTTRMGTLRAYEDNYQTCNGRLRKLTPREGLRLMGFPDSFKIVCSHTQTYKQIGNSIVVDVMAALIDKVLQAL